MKQTNVNEYFKPETINEAISILDEYKGEISILAGGTDLMVDNDPAMEALLDIDDLALNYIKKDDEYLKIGSATTFNEILESKEIYSDFRGLWDSAKVLADKTIRNVATIGGNICSSVPSGDSIPPLMTMDAVLVIRTAKEELKVKIEDFFTGPKQNVLKKGQILKEIIIPYKKSSGSIFKKVSRNSVDLATSNVAVLITVDGDDKITEAKIAFGAVAPTVVRAKELEDKLIGTKAEKKIIKENLDLVSKAISPITDVRSTAKYRGEVSKVMVKRAIIEAYQRAVGK